MKPDLQIKPTVLVSEIKRPLVEAFGSRLSEVVLFGSFARGTDNTESDIDTLVVLEPFLNFAADLRIALAAVYPLSVKYRHRISVKLISFSEYYQANPPILTTIRQEGVPA